MIIKNERYFIGVDFGIKDEDFKCASDIEMKQKTRKLYGKKI